MASEQMIERLSRHPFIHELSQPHLESLAKCASIVSFKEGESLVKEGEYASTFYLISSGRIALQFNAGPRGSARIQTVGPGEIVGWSWLIPPYRWHNDAIAIEPGQAFALDGAWLRSHCEEDHDFGYEIMKRIVHIVEQRLHGTRLQLIDMYHIPKEFGS